MTRRTRIAAWVFAIISILGFLDFESQFRNPVLGIFLLNSAGSWLVLCLNKTWERTVAAVSCAFWALSLQSILIDNWRPFGASLAILISAWAILLAAQVVVILTEKPVSTSQGNHT